jgi:hypothetical protein
VSIVPGASVDLFEFLAPATPEPLTTDVVDQWLAIQDEQPAPDLATPVPASAPVRAARRHITSSNDDHELHLFLADDEPSESGGELAKTTPAGAGEEWPVDVLLADEWSVSRLVH